jgi:hypothetical protein
MGTSKTIYSGIDNSEIWQNAKKLTSNIMEFLPKEEIPEISVFRSCLNYLKDKDLGLDWKTEVDCYLGVPNHLEKFNELGKVEFAKFPLAIICPLASEKPFFFSLLRKECIDGTTLNGSSHLMHFTPSEFFQCERNFKERLEEGNSFSYTHFSDERGFYMQDENLDEKLKDDEVEYAYYFKEALLNDEYYIRLHNLKVDIFLTSLMLYFELSHGADYILLGLEDYDMDKIQEINTKYLDWDLRDFHSFLLDRDDVHITYLLSTFSTFVSLLHSHYQMTIEHFNEDPENSILQCEIEMIEHLAGNTDQQLLDEIIGQKFIRA